MEIQIDLQMAGQEEVQTKKKAPNGAFFLISLIQEFRTTHQD